ncbi:short-subunit dehydrogenase [Isoptericola sp. CG 20/1183]|uniref:Short-subunit dehydrogenase n=1 Tax=Isoptericola halotolerans TaxID=300560 RepID=A0ABX5EHJ9_9MICO|nr:MULTISPECIES: SDR family oxidoreductase [Isoptericola]PRZ06996.1 short-subunit dehydrogenase [Isoptericola halotolerans]PRZ07332.1 short-subunit dehydrogenase [Isoptericola sp. CG 20/1183]
MKVKGSVAVVTGASSGIGRATALRLARSGADVVLAARRPGALESAAAECRRHGVRALAVPTDVSDADAVERLARHAAARFGRIDVWVNDAAVSLFGRVTDVPLEDFRRLVDVNVMGTVHGVRAALAHMRPQGRGVIVNIASILGEVPQPYTAAYCLSKAAVRSLSVSVRSELALDGLTGIEVTTVLPPTIDTPLFDQVANDSGRAVRAMPPVYSPERVARAVVGAVRSPRREVVVSTAGRLMAWQHRLSPRAVEATMAAQTDLLQLSRRQAAEATSGNLFEPGPESAGAVHGGWGGRRRTAQRRLLTVGVVVGGAVLARGAQRRRRA